MAHISHSLPKAELISVIELIDELSRCVTLDGAESLLGQTRELLRAECAVCGMGRIDKQGNIDINTIVNSGYPGEWLNLYFKEGLYRHDPVVQHHMRFSEPELWSTIRKEFVNEKAKAVTEWAGAYGLQYGLSSSVYLPVTGMFSLFCFASAKDTFTKRHKDLLGALTLHLNMAITETSRVSPASRKKTAAQESLIQ